MVGASNETLRVRHVNANWEAGLDGGDGVFAVLVVTEDGVRHTLTPSVTALGPLLAMIRASLVLLWDPTHRTLIGANIVGEWVHPDFSGRCRG